MATGWQDPTTKSDRYSVFRLVDGATADTSAPTASTDGVPWSEGADHAPHGVLSKEAERCLVAVYESSGSGTLSIGYVKIWGYLASIDKWFPIGTGADADRGKLNDRLAIGEVAADDLRLIEVLSDVTVFDRLHAELDTVGGTSPVLNVDLIIPRHIARQR